jgi:hypothetical protein
MLREKPMSAVPERDQCKAELEQMIAAGIFAKAPSLALLLEYVCAKYFEGQAHQIKEYNIAVEALGRPPSFDPRQDSIVRVEAFRLRKRLKQYYENDGADRPLRIVIPSGQYVPQFLENGPAASNGETPESGPEHIAEHMDDEEAALEASLPVAPHRELVITPAPLAISPSTILTPRSPAWVRWATFLGIPLMVVLAIAVWYSRAHSAAKAIGVLKSASLPLGAEPEEIRILCGSSDARHVDGSGNGWSGDRFFHGGSEFPTPNHIISRAPDPELFRHRREGDFSYDIPLKPGTYELHLYFAETLFGENNTAGGGESSRVFNVLLNGRPALRTFDALSDAGGSNTADERVFKDISPAADGMLHVGFARLANNLPFLNALEIVPGIPGRMRPVRIVARAQNYTDQRGQVWSADRYFSHGFAVPRSEPVSNTADPEMFQAERFGNFNYAIPVPEGHYTVTLKFAETWFGPGNPGSGGANSRIFDVYCNGIALLRNFDIFRAAGGPQRAIEKSFHGLVPNAQGKIELAFVPVVNYASINAIEVVDESK